jgi:predicted DNA-binding transcriptional regulator YafY
LGCNITQKGGVYLVTTERRLAILRLLCRRRYETIKNIAAEFNISESTARRDIQALSRDAPIYTQTGRYGGGVYVTDNYTMDRMYFNDCEIKVLEKVIDSIENQEKCVLNPSEYTIIKKLLKEYTKPCLHIT